jgi:hypothetical protein
VACEIFLWAWHRGGATTLYYVVRNSVIAEQAREMLDGCGLDIVKVITPRELVVLPRADLVVVDEIYHVVYNLTLDLDHEGKLSGIFDPEKAK